MGQPAHDTTTAESQTPNDPTPTEAAPESHRGVLPGPRDHEVLTRTHRCGRDVRQ